MAAFIFAGIYFLWFEYFRLFRAGFILFILILADFLRNNSAFVFDSCVNPTANNYPLNINASTDNLIALIKNMKIRSAIFTCDLLKKTMPSLPILCHRLRYFCNHPIFKALIIHVTHKMQ